MIISAGLNFYKIFMNDTFSANLRMAGLFKIDNTNLVVLRIEKNPLKIEYILCECLRFY